MDPPLTAADIRDIVAKVPEKARIYFYSAGHTIEVVAEWTEGTQPMRRRLVLLPGVYSTGGQCE